MNVRDMNVNLVKFVSRPVAALTICGALSACAFNPPTDPASPLAKKIDSTVTASNSYPRWQDFPAAPVNLPDAAYVRGAVTGLETSQSALNAQVAAIDWQLGDADQYVRAVRERLAADGVEIPTANTPAEIEAFAASLRARAKAPPPIDRPIR